MTETPITDGPWSALPVRAGAALALAVALAACEGGYTEAVSPCVDADVRFSFRATPETGTPSVSRRAGPDCAFTALGAP